MIEAESLPDDHNPMENGDQESSIPKQENEIIEESEKIKDMEEVHHSHRNHHARKFKDYLFEFLMLFLAISGGFCAENLRESYTEHHKEKQYIGSLTKDIEYDQANIQRILKSNERQIKGIDSLICLLENPIQDSDLQKFYYLTCGNLNNFEEFAPHDITIIQLKNSSGLRLIENKSVSDSIVRYYSDIDLFHENNEKVYYQFSMDNVKLEMTFIDFNAFKNKRWELYDKTKIKEFKNRAIIFNDALRWDNHMLNIFQKQGASLLKNIKKEYKINS